MAYYFRSDFSQKLSTCPACGENKLFIKTFFKILSLYYFPIYPLGKRAVGSCRGCQKQFSIGEDAQLDVQMNEAIDRLNVPKYFKLGAILIPSVLFISVLLILIWP